MTKLAELRHERDQLSAKANEINKAHPNDRSMPKAASQELDGLLHQIECVDAQLDVYKATTLSFRKGTFRSTTLGFSSEMLASSSPT